MILTTMVLMAGVTIGQAQSAHATAGAASDLTRILRKPIPDKLVVLTFDDGPASGYTVVAPILKTLGFGGSFYVCDFDSFNTRKDWYMTWRQMKALADEGFEIGNHTRGHAGGAGIGPFLDMEDELLANNVPKPATIAWPVFQVNTATYPELAAHGYIFGRGGHFRPYRPTVDNPFDIPCLGAGTVEEFVKSVRQATGGRIVVLIYHGVPDMEHLAVSLDPAVFKVEMQYLKDNGYTVIALRDLAEYIDPAKAAKLPPTARDAKDATPATLVKEEHPPGVVPAQAGARKAPAVAATKTVPSEAKDMLTFVLPGPISSIIAGTTIGVYVPPATDVKVLAPTFTLSPYAAAVPASGTARDFSHPQTYTVTAQDGSSQVYKVTVIRSSQPNTFTWHSATVGNWSDATKWSNNLASGSAPVAAGQPDYVLNFNCVGNYVVSNDLSAGFLLNQLNLGNHSLTLAGNPIAFAANRVTGALPGITLNAQFQDARITAPVQLGSDVAVGVMDRGYVTLGGLVSGTGALIKNGAGTLKISNVTNTYSGGTVINAGELYLFVANHGLGTGSVTLNEDAELVLEHVDGTNPLILNGGTIDAGNGFGDSWNGPITLNGVTKIAAYAGFHLNRSGGGITGPGGLTQIGPQGGFGRVNSGWVFLWGTNAYTGPTALEQGTLIVKKAASLYNANAASWTPAQISVHPAATLVLSAGGPGEFTGANLGTLLKNLTTSVNNNGLMARSVFVLDTANATGPVAIPDTIKDSEGPGGGAFLLEKWGAGTLQLSGKNTYTGQTIVEGGALSVSSLNSVANPRGSSSLGAPTDIETGEIVMGSGDGECALVYSGTGETSDRVINLAGKTSTVAFDQSGTGLLKLTSTFVISGFGAKKIVALRGDTAGTGELAGNIVDPYDRAGKATTAVTKAGTGTWTLSGTNTYTGPTTVRQGTLSLASARSLGAEADVYISEGATLDLTFAGEMRIRKLYLDGKLQPAGTYSAANAPKHIKGRGMLRT